MNQYTDDQIEKFFRATISGIYLNACRENGGAAEEGFYQNQLSEFRSGFLFAVNTINEGE